METCWAGCLGNCNPKLSKEHLVSEGVFLDDIVQVQGFPWCKDEPKQIGLANLTAKILCRDHNSALSDLDEQAAKTARTLREMQRLGNVRKALKSDRWNVVQYKLDGPTLERWFLKTLINLCLGQAYPVGRGGEVIGRPTEKLVQIAYGLAKFENRAGLYSVIHQGLAINPGETWGFTPLIKNGHHIEAGLFSFRGFTFLLFLETEGPPMPLTGITFNGVDIGRAQLNFHNCKMTEMTGKYRSQELITEW